MGLKVKANLAASGETEPLLLHHGFVSLAGTWEGTVALEVDPSGDDDWIPLTDLDGNAYEFTSNVTAAVDNGAAVKTRVAFTRTSGTLDAVLMGDFV